MGHYPKELPDPEQPLAAGASGDPAEPGERALEDDRWRECQQGKWDRGGREGKKKLVFPTSW